VAAAPTWLVWSPNDGVLRRERTRKLAITWWLALQGEGWELTGGSRHNVGIYQRYARRHGQQREAWFIRGDLPAALVEKFIPGRWDPAQPPLYPHDGKRRFTKVAR
jgi:hypothetical protein